MSGNTSGDNTNAWEAPNVNTNLRGRALLRAMERAIAKLEGTRQLIHAQNQELLQRAMRVHDHHQESARDLATHIQKTGVGTEPTVEDAYGQHLTDRAKMDDLMSLLSYNAKNFISKIDPETPPVRIHQMAAPSSDYPEDSTGGVSVSDEGEQETQEEAPEEDGENPENTGRE